MKNKINSKGISLIVLIITIIVIIILATAIILSLNDNNVINDADKARYESDRANMQALLTATINEIATQNLGRVNIQAIQINTVTSGENQVSGEITYIVKSRVSTDNINGTIVFDKGTNTATKYYTGKKLPIYEIGETKWYTDSKGILSLEVAGVKYGSGEEEILAPGLYDENGNITISWDELTSTDYKSFRYICDEWFTVTTGAILNIYDYKNLSCAFDYESSSNLSCEYINGKLVILDGIESIDGYGFYDCENLTSITIPNSVTSIGGQAFSDCVNLISINIPDGVTEIKSRTFYNCESLESITIPDKITNIDRYSFAQCTELNEINYLGTQEKWNTITFGENWNNYCSEITVHCTDGDIIIPANYI